jgi:hypothetical protein
MARETPRRLSRAWMTLTHRPNEQGKTTAWPLRWRTSRTTFNRATVVPEGGTVRRNTEPSGIAGGALSH